MVANGNCDSIGIITQAHRERMLNNYINIWNGDLSLVNETFEQAVTLQADRFPTGAHGSSQFAPSVNSSTAFGAFVQGTRSSLREYKIIPQYSAGEGRHIAVRWVMQGVMSNHFTPVPTYVAFRELAGVESTN
jgi:hypothetical protein